MDRFHAIQVFVKVAELGGFAAAARDLSISPPAVTRAIAALENHLGTRLFLRTTRSIRLTESGRRFLEDTKRILLDLQEAEDAAAGSHGTPRGHLSITAPVLFGRMFVTPLLGVFLDRHPLLSARTLYVDRNVNLMDEGMDVALRIGNLADSSMIATRVGSVGHVVFASPEYLEVHGEPGHPNDLTEHRLIQSVAIGAAGGNWAFLDQGKSTTVRVNAPLKMNTNDAVIELALRGWGISRLLSYQIAPYLAEGRLKHLLVDFEQQPLPIYVLHQEGRMVSAKVRAFVDFLVAHLREDPALN